MRLERIGFRYGRSGPWVLRDLTLEAPPATIIEVSGRNGAGKSTLLRVAAGILRPPRGRGRIVERPARVGYAPERFPVGQPFTVASYLRHMARIRRLDGMRPDAAAKTAETADRLGLMPLMDVRLPELSKGSAQKVGIVQALMGDPMLLVLDEPFAGLDAQARSAVPALLTELTAEGATVLVSDHQHCLRAMDGVTRVRVEAGTVVAAAVPPREVDDLVVLEVTVPAGRAEPLTARLQAEGYGVARRDGAARRDGSARKDDVSEGDRVSGRDRG